MSHWMIEIALIGAAGPNARWIGSLITGIFFYFYGAASFNAWRDRVARLTAIT